MRQIVILLIRAYQVVLGPLMGGGCRFEPSCSEYCLVAVRRHGCLKGLWLGLRRLLCCHPFHAGGFDPVPERTPNHLQG